MTMCLSCITVLVNVGLGGQFLFMWLRGWCIAFVVAFPLAYVLPPRINRLLTHLGVK